MLAEIDIPEFLERMHQRGQRLALRLVERLGARARRVRVKAGEDVLAREDLWCVFIESGVLRVQHAARAVRLLGAGDLLVADSHTGLEDTTLEASCDCDLRALSRSDLIGALSDSPDLLHLWLEWMAVERDVEVALIALALEATPHEAVRGVMHRFEEGEVILHKGETCRELLEVVEGSVVEQADGDAARVLRSGELVGEVAALSGQPSTTTLTAAAPCVVRAFAPQELERLGRTRPRLLAGLARVLARRAGSS